MQKASIFLSKRENRVLFDPIAQLLQCRNELNFELLEMDPSAWALNPEQYSQLFEKTQPQFLFIDLTGTRLVTANRILRYISQISNRFSQIFVIHDIGLDAVTDVCVSENVKSIEYPFEIERIMAAFPPSPHSSPKYWPASFAQLRGFFHSPINLYLKLSDAKLVRAVKKGSESFQSQLKYYESKGIVQFWIPCGELEDFTRAIAKAHYAGSLEKFAQNTELDEYPIDQQSISKFSEWIGASAEAKETTEKNFKVALGALRRSQQLQNFYTELKQGKSIHRMTQNYLITLLSTSICLNDKENFSAAELQSLAFASLLSSLGFSEDEYQRRLNLLLAASLAGNGVNRFVTKQIETSSQSAGLWDICPEEVSRLLNDGASSFSTETPETLLQPLSVAFLVAQEFVAAVLGLPGLDWAQQLKLRAFSYGDSPVKTALLEFVRKVDFTAETETEINQVA